MIKAFGPLAAVVLLLSGYYTAAACSCSGYPSACDSFSRADAVFTGTVTKTVGPGSLTSWGENRSYLAVQKVYKGSVPKQVRFVWGMDSCDVGMQAGEKWLLYATRLNKSGTLWSIGGCDRSRIIEPGLDDLNYLDSEFRSKKATRLSGSFTYTSGLPFRNAEIEIDGGGEKRSIKTDDFGFYQIFGLKPGTYKIGPLALDNWNAFISSNGNRPPEVPNFDKRTDRLTVNIGANTCVETAFRLPTENHIKGSVLTEVGTPVPDVCVKALRIDDNASNRAEIEDCVNEDGVFLFDGLPAGNYILRVESRLLNRPWAPNRFPSVYFPSSSSRSGSKPIAVSDEISPEVRIAIPKDHPIRLLEGVVVFSDGSPVADETVLFTFQDGTEKRTIDTRTDEKGRFTLPVTIGLRGSLVAEGRIWEHEIETCSKLSKLRKYASGVEFTLLTESSKPLPMAIRKNRSDLLLKLPYSKCDETP